MSHAPEEEKEQEEDEEEDDPHVRVLVSATKQLEKPIPDHGRAGRRGDGAPQKAQGVVAEEQRRTHPVFAEALKKRQSVPPWTRNEWPATGAGLIVQLRPACLLFQCTEVRNRALDLIVSKLG